MEVICVDDKFHPESIRMIPNRPVQDKMYTIGEIIKTVEGKTGITLEELDNPPIEHPSGLGTFQPSFDIKRFAMLDGSPVNKEKIKDKKLV